MTVKNAELLEQTMQFLKDHPESHHQTTIWTDSCGTPGCFIGWAMHLAEVDLFEVSMDAVEWAKDAFGITLTEAAVIFGPRNTIEALELMVKDLLNEGKLNGHTDDYLNWSKA